MFFTEAELAYLRSQPLGRLCTIGPDGAPQARPVGVHVAADGTIDIYGYSNAKTQKWRNVESDPRVTFVVDDLASRDPWTVRGVEVRGLARTYDGDRARAVGLSGEVIRIRPRKIIAWGLDDQRMTSRKVEG